MSDIIARSGPKSPLVIVSSQPVEPLQQGDGLAVGILSVEFTLLQPDVQFEVEILENGEEEQRTGAVIQKALRIGLVEGAKMHSEWHKETDRTIWEVIRNAIGTEEAATQEQEGQ